MIPVNQIILFFCDADLEDSNKFNEYVSEVRVNLSKIINPVSNIDNYIYIYIYILILIKFLFYHHTSSNLHQ